MKLSRVRRWVPVTVKDVKHNIIALKGNTPRVMVAHVSNSPP